MRRREGHPRTHGRGGCSGHSVDRFSIQWTECPIGTCSLPALRLQTLCVEIQSAQARGTILGSCLSSLDRLRRRDNVPARLEMTAGLGQAF